MKMKSLKVITSLMLVLTLVLAGCGGATEEAPAKAEEKTEAATEAAKAEGGSEEAAAPEAQWEGTVKVQLIGNWAMEATTDPVTGQKRQGVQVLKDEFEKRYPGATLEFVLMGWDSYTQKTQAMLTVGECDVYQAPGIASFAAQGLLEPLQPYIDRDGYDLGMYVNGQVDGWKAMSPEDEELQIYGMPVLADTRLIMYDTQIFDEWGVEYLSEFPTLEELETKAAAMTGTNPVSGEQNYGVAFKGKDTADTMVNIAELKGGTWGTGFRPEELTFNFNTPEFIEAGEWLVMMKQYAPAGVVTNQGLEKWGTPSNDIAIHLREYPGHIIDFGKVPGQENRYKVARLFVNEEVGMGGMFAGSPFVIGENSNNKDLAWEFIKFSSSDFYQKFILNEYQQVPCVNTAFEWDEIKGSENLTMMMESMQVLWAPRYPYRAAQPRYILSDAAERYMLADATVAEALEDAQAEADQWVKDLQ